AGCAPLVLDASPKPAPIGAPNGLAPSGGASLSRDARDRAERGLVLDGAVVRLEPDDTGLGREHLGTSLATVEPYAKDGRAELGNLRPCLIQNLVGRRRGH